MRILLYLHTNLLVSIALFTSHPPLEARIEALQETRLAGSGGSSQTSR